MPVAVSANSLKTQLSTASGNASLSFTRPPPLHSAPACIYHTALESSRYLYLWPLTISYKGFGGRDPVWFNFASLVLNTRTSTLLMSGHFWFKEWRPLQYGSQGIGMSPGTRDDRVQGYVLTPSPFRPVWLEDSQRAHGASGKWRVGQAEQLLLLVALVFRLIPRKVRPAITSLPLPTWPNLGAYINR